MRYFKSQGLYPVLIVVVLAGVWLVNSLRQSQTAQAETSSLRNSLYWEPWEVVPGGGGACFSELDLRNPRIPFTVTILHPSGDRELLNETIRRLVRSGATPQPWPEQSIQAFAILRTLCRASWEELYAKIGYFDRGKVTALMHNPKQPTEADFRQAIIHANYDEMGTAQAALEWFPKADENKVIGNP